MSPQKERDRKGRKVSVRLDPKVYAVLKSLAEADRRSVTDYLRLLIADTVADRHAKSR